VFSFWGGGGLCVVWFFFLCGYSIEFLGGCVNSFCGGWGGEGVFLDVFGVLWVGGGGVFFFFWGVLVCVRVGSSRVCLGSRRLLLV